MKASTAVANNYNSDVLYRPFRVPVQLRDICPVTVASSEDAFCPPCMLILKAYTTKHSLPMPHLGNAASIQARRLLWAFLQYEIISLPGTRKASVLGGLGGFVKCTQMNICRWFPMYNIKAAVSPLHLNVDTEN